MTDILPDDTPITAELHAAMWKLDAVREDSLLYSTNDAQAHIRTAIELLRPAPLAADVEGGGLPKSVTVHDWIEDYVDEDNGYYCHTCDKCAQSFFGHKRRVGDCKKCYLEWVYDNLPKLRAALAGLVEAVECKHQIEGALMKSDALKAAKAALGDNDEN